MPVHPVPVYAAGELRSQTPGRHAFEAVYQPGHWDLWRVLNEQVHVIVFPIELPQLGAEIGADLPHGVLAAAEHVRIEHAASVLRHEDQLNMERGNTCLPRR